MYYPSYLKTEYRLEAIRMKSKNNSAASLIASIIVSVFSIHNRLILPNKGKAAPIPLSARQAILRM